MSKIKLNLSEQDLSDILEILEREVSGYSVTYAPDRIVRLREAIKQLKS